MAEAKCLLPAVATTHAARSLVRRRSLLCDQRTHSTSSLLLLRRRRLAQRICPAAQFGDRDASKSGSEVPAAAEYSEAANEDLLFFLFQLDLATRLQRALNRDEYETAQLVREKINEVEKEVTKRMESRKGGASAKDEVQAKELALIRLRSELQKAVDSENYADAARLRDQVSKLEAESLAASAKAQIYESVKYAFRLGQKVRHRLHGYRCVVCGMDPVCCESEAWMTSAKVDELPRGRNQAFYQVLVDERQEPDLLIAYVAEDNLVTPSSSDPEMVTHPYIYFLFYGMDAAGDYIPAKQLREKWGVRKPSDDDG